jgi:hypothetical protein
LYYLFLVSIAMGDAPVAGAKPKRAFRILQIISHKNEHDAGGPQAYRMKK